MEIPVATPGPTELHDAPSVVKDDAAPAVDSAEVKPLFILRPKKGFNPIPFREIWQFRDLLFTLAQRDVKLRYRQTALGAIWVILQPLIGAGIFTFVFSKVANVPSPAGVPYFALTFASLLGWNLFANTMTKASSSLVGNAGLVSKVYFPRLILPMSTSFGALVDFAVGLGMLVVLLLVFGVPFTVNLLFLPVVLLVALLSALGLGAYFASLMVSYRDVQYVVPVLTQFFMYASPVMYAATVVPHSVRTVYSINPLVGMMEGFQWSLLGINVPNWHVVAYSVVFSVIIFVLGALSFQKMERRFADVI